MYSQVAGLDGEDTVCSGGSRCQCGDNSWSCHFDIGLRAHILFGYMPAGGNAGYYSMDREKGTPHALFVFKGIVLVAVLFSGTVYCCVGCRDLLSCNVAGTLLYIRKHSLQPVATDMETRQQSACFFRAEDKQLCFLGDNPMNKKRRCVWRFARAAGNNRDYGLAQRADLL